MASGYTQVSVSARTWFVKHVYMFQSQKTGLFQLYVSSMTGSSSCNTYNLLCIKSCSLFNSFSELWESPVSMLLENPLRLSVYLCLVLQQLLSSIELIVTFLPLDTVNCREFSCHYNPVFYTINVYSIPCFAVYLYS